ncbi:MAG: chromate resistance protein ChrB domain-containing protein [Candidatus Njordarchaeia archaeon]
MKWVTRERAKVDRIACPWLIKKFVDPDAEFLFVPKEKVLEVAEKENAIPFDYPSVELGHHDGKCSFEAIVEKYNIDDPAIKCLAEIVHGADVKEDLYKIPESAGLRAIAHGFALLVEDDYKKMELEFPIYDALYEYCKKKVAGEKV